MYTTLISAPQLQALQASGAPLMIFDCSFDLMNPAAGEEQYRKAHIPGAVYADLDTALSDQGVIDPDGTHRPHPDAASGGRHPLPSREKFAIWLSSVGFANDDAGRRLRPQCQQLLRAPVVDAEVGGPRSGGCARWRAAGLAGRRRRSHRPRRDLALPVELQARGPNCARWRRRSRSRNRSERSRRPSSMHDPRPATVARSSHSIRWQAISPAR